MNYQIVRNNGCGWSDDFEGSEFCVYDNVDNAIECCHDIANIWKCSVDNFGFVLIDSSGFWYEHDVELVPR